MRQVSGGHRGPTRPPALKRAPKRASKSTARKRTAPKARGRRLSAARVWERRVEGWRRFFIRHSYLRSYGVLALLTLGAYAIWAGGLVERSSNFITETANSAMVNAGFTVSRITISGHIETSPSDVMDALGIRYGMPIFELRLSELKTRVESLDWVESATVVRALPGTIHITIGEREPYAIWQYQGQLYVISAEGTVISSASVDHYGHLPHVVGLGAQRNARDLFLALEAVPTIAPRVRYGVRVSDRRWDLHFDSGVVVQLPENNLVAALHALARLEAEHRLLARAIETVDLRLEDRIVVLPRSAQPSSGPAFVFPTGERET